MTQAAEKHQLLNAYCAIPLLIYVRLKHNFFSAHVMFCTKFQAQFSMQRRSAQSHVAPFTLPWILIYLSSVYRALKWWSTSDLITLPYPAFPILGQVSQFRSLSFTQASPHQVLMSLTGNTCYTLALPTDGTISYY